MSPRLPIVWDKASQTWRVMRGREVLKAFPTLLAAEAWVLAQTEDDPA